jgi:putative transposase
MARSTYYYRSRKKSDERLAKSIEPVVKENAGYGYRRVTRDLHLKGKIINGKVVLRIMRDNGWLCRKKKAYKGTTESNHTCPIYPNLSKNVQIDGINQLWVSDITYLPLRKGFAYLAMIMDAYSRKIIGYEISHMLDKRLSMSALEMAIKDRNPKGCIHHSDRGVQYACREYAEKLKEHGFKISMSRKGNPYDNAKAESWMKTLKTEEVRINEYETLEDAREGVTRYIESVYNRRRLHSALGYMPPVEFEKRISTYPQN